MNIKRRTIERVRITGPMDERLEAFGYCQRNGFLVVESGPQRGPRNGPTFDVTRFGLTGERRRAG